MASEASHIKTVCCMCQVLLSGLADAPETSHGIGPCCWAAFRSSLGLAPSPFPAAHLAPGDEGAGLSRLASGGSVSTPLAARSEVRA